MIHHTKNLKETYEVAGRFVAETILGKTKTRQGATVVGLYGDLGAGKTSFTQGIAKAFDIKEQITSPTFVLEKIYKLNKKFPYDNLIHIDAYRLNDSSEMSALGWDEIVKDPKNIIFIEWPERVMEVLPVKMIRVYFEAGEKEGERRIEILC